jgi:hypothetical protein
MALARDGFGGLVTVSCAAALSINDKALTNTRIDGARKRMRLIVPGWGQIERRVREIARG